MMDLTEIINNTYNLTDEIKKTKEYLTLKEKYELLVNNDVSSLLIKEFNEAKSIYSTNPSKENTHYLSLKKKALYENSLYIDYINALKEYNDFVKVIEITINDKIFSETVNNLLIRSKNKWYKDKNY